MLERSRSAYSLQTVSLDTGPIEAEPLAAFFCSYPEILNPCNAVIKFWHSEVLLLYRINGRHGFDLFDRGGMVKSRKTAVFFHTRDPNVRLRWHHIRALRMDPARGFWFRYRRCFRHVDLRDVPATRIRDALVVAIQTKLHPEGFDFRGHCCYNFAHDLMTVLGSLAGRPDNDFKPVYIWETNLCAWCTSVNLETYLRRNGYGEACDDLSAQERDAILANGGDPYHGSASCCVPTTARRRRKTQQHNSATAKHGAQTTKQEDNNKQHQRATKITHHDQQHVVPLSSGSLAAQHMLARSMSKTSVLSDLTHNST